MPRYIELRALCRGQSATCPLPGSASDDLSNLRSLMNPREVDIDAVPKEPPHISESAGDSFRTGAERPVVTCPRMPRELPSIAAAGLEPATQGL